MMGALDNQNPAVGGRSCYCKNPAVHGGSIKKKKKSKLQKKIDDVGSRLWRNKADKLWREIVFLLAKGCCEVCGSKEFVQAHHIFPRNITLYRHAVMNGILLCPSDHKYNFKFSAHKNPIRFAIWLMKNQPLRWAWLLQHENILTSESPKFNFKEIYSQLQKYYIDIGGNLDVLRSQTTIEPKQGCSELQHEHSTSSASTESNITQSTNDVAQTTTTTNKEM